jgi:signal transduction histidine kinase
VPQIQAQVAAAIVHATREALANVAAHAGTGEAWVSVTLAAGALRVTVRDAGAGFDPARVDPARLGLRRSITERVTDWGGRASVRSAPGQGTLVIMSWPGAVPVAGADLVAAESSW